MGVLYPLVARAGALAEVDSVLAAARGGRGSLVALTGEPGIGKTRLAEAAADRAAGFEVIWTWCPPAAGGAPLRPWSRVVRTLAAGHAAAARLVDGSPFLAALAGRCWWSSTTRTRLTRRRCGCWPSWPPPCAPCRRPCWSPRAMATRPGRAGWTSAVRCFGPAW